jgi:hypothetical protein
MKLENEDDKLTECNIHPGLSLNSLGNKSVIATDKAISVG